MNVSIIIPNYNRVALVKETLDNMLLQTCLKKEIIVVDDGSTDESVEVLKRYGNRIKLIVQENQGVGAARNKGLQHAEGTFIQFMDSDDLAGPKKIENQIKTLEANNADIVYGPWAKVEIKDRTLISREKVIQQKPLPPSRSPVEWHVSQWSMVLQSCLFRKSILDKAGNFRTDWKVAEDQDLFARCLLAGGKLVHANNSITFYRLHESEKLTTTGTSDKERMLDWAEYIVESRDQLLNGNPSIDPKNLRAFRLRAWDAARALNEFDDPQVPAIQSKLASIYSGYSETRIEQTKLLLRLYGGIRARAVGTRYPKCFGTKEFTKFQTKEAKYLGYKIKILP